MGKEKPIEHISEDLCLLDDINDDTIIQQLKKRYESNQVYTRINDNILIFINSKKAGNSNSYQISLEYASNYKNTNMISNHTSCHLFQMVNQMYLHMRRTGINQSIILSGDKGSGKSESGNMVLSHLIALSSVKKESKLQTQMVHIQSILNAFGHAKTSSHQNASQFGKYVEIQFNERGRMIGCKILNYLLDKRRLIKQRQGSNFHVFYYLLMGASIKEKQSIDLLDYRDYRYTRSNASPFSVDESVEFYESLKASLRHFGLGKRYQARIIQLLASILNLGQLVFVDDQTIQEAAFVRNSDLLESVADSLGVDPYQLQDVLTYKTKLIGKDVTTVILDAENASQQRDQLATVLYSLLFSWLIETINSKLCVENVQNVIGILDLPGWDISPASANLEQFCVNYANEKLEQYILNYIFEVHPTDYKEDMLDDYPSIPYKSNSLCIDLIDKSRHGIIDLINHQTKKGTGQQEDYPAQFALMDTFNKNHAGHPALGFEKDDTGNKLFLIQHFNGPQLYQPTDFIENNRDALDADFVSLFRGGTDRSPSTNSFLVALFEDKSIRTEPHPKDANQIMFAQQKNQPSRTPSMSRSRSLLRNNKAVAEKQKSKKLVPTALGQIKSSMQDLFESLDETIPWFVFCILPNRHPSTLDFNTEFVRRQVEIMQLSSIALNMTQYPYTNIFSLDDFLVRYESLSNSEEVQDPEELNKKEKCQQILEIFESIHADDTMFGNNNIYLNDRAWRGLEDKLREMEKEDQKKQRDGLRESRGVLSGTNVSSIHTGLTSIREDEYSQKSGSSNDGLLPDSHKKKSEPSLKERRALAAAQAAQAGLPMPISIGHSNRSQSNSSYNSDDQHSVMSEDLSSQNPSQADYQSQIEEVSEFFEMKAIGQSGVKDYDDEDLEPTEARKRWVWFVWGMTWWVPTSCMVWCGRMKRADIQIAWREKLTLCMIIFLMSGLIIWFLVFFGQFICPHQDLFSVSELQAHSTSGNAFASIRGEVFDLSEFAPHHWASQVISSNAITAYGGKDITDLFPVQVSAVCQGVNGSVSENVALEHHFNLTDVNSHFHDFRAWTDDPRPDWYYEKMKYLRKNYKVGTMSYTDKDVRRQARVPVDMSGVKMTRTWAILNGSVYDLTYYLNNGVQIQIAEGAGTPNDTNTNFMADVIVDLFKERAGQDISKYWNALPLDEDAKLRQAVCLRNLFYVGKLDMRKSPQCIFSEYLLLIVTVFLCLVIVFKFLAALQIRKKKEPEDHEKFVICQVPCYTESEEELKKTIDSIACLKYDDKRKLLFIVCDGMIVGGGNDRPTPRIVLDVLGVDPHEDPEPLSFFSVGEGQKQHNMAKIYSGLYEIRGHAVPYLVVSKVGKPNERQKPGNRGKRDSQLILMKFLNKVHFNAPMTPMELEMYHQIKNVIGVNPSYYEYILMLDADTEIVPDALSRMVSAFVNDGKIIGLCGETKLSNEKDTWVTMIQVYEYFISHYMIKAFESLFGSVTCLPGCFCMYRIRSSTKNQPLLISNEVINDYNINRVDTLHKKNLLHLGEDRYLTTLILKHFPMYKTKFVSDAKCLTNAPDQWSVLLSQRRRWINSTIHNLGELVFLPQLCGFCCFSMRFVVMLDLISTLVQPAIVGYIVYLIYTLATSASNVPIMSVLTIAGVYGLQTIIFIIHRKWEHIVWMIVSIFAIPIFSFYIPIYAYWHFDDFSWGNTRVVLGEKGKKKVVGADEGRFDPSVIPTMTWEKYEEELYSEDYNQNDTASVVSKGSTHSYNSSSSYNSNVHRQPYNNPYQQSPLQNQQNFATNPYVMNPNLNLYNNSSITNPYIMPPNSIYSMSATNSYQMGLNNSFASSPLQNSHSSMIQTNPYQYPVMNGFNQQPYLYTNPQPPPFQ